MLAAARKYGRVVQVGTQRRSTPHIIEARDNIINQGKLGKIGLVEIYCYYHMRAESNPPDTNPPGNLDYEMWTGPAPMRPYNALVHPRSWRAFTEYGLYLFYGLFLGLYVWGMYRRDAGLKLFVQAYLLAQLLGSVLLVRILKMMWGRARPDVTPLADFGSDWVGFTWQAGHHSFPSGHTADIVTSALFAALAIRNAWLAAVCVVWAGALALSRLALAKHYPSDALVGAVIALAVSLLVWRYWLQPRLARTALGKTLQWWSPEQARS